MVGRAEVGRVPAHVDGPPAGDRPRAASAEPASRAPRKVCRGRSADEPGRSQYGRMTTRSPTHRFRTSRRGAPIIAPKEHLRITPVREDGEDRVGVPARAAFPTPTRRRSAGARPARAPRPGSARRRTRLQVALPEVRVRRRRLVVPPRVAPQPARHRFESQRPLPLRLSGRPLPAQAAYAWPRRSGVAHRLAAGTVRRTRPGPAHSSDASRHQDCGATGCGSFCGASRRAG